MIPRSFTTSSNYMCCFVLIERPLDWQKLQTVCLNKSAASAFNVGVSEQYGRIVELSHSYTPAHTEIWIFESSHSESLQSEQVWLRIWKPVKCFKSGWARLICRAVGRCFLCMKVWCTVVWWLIYTEHITQLTSVCISNFLSAAAGLVSLCFHRFFSWCSGLDSLTTVWTDSHVTNNKQLHCGKKKIRTNMQNAHLGRASS